MRNCLNILTCLLLAMVVAGCQRIPLYDAEANMCLSLEIECEIENVGVVPQPEAMVVAFYDKDSHRFLSRDFTGPKGGPVNVAPGVYDMLVYNFDTEYTVIRNEGNLYTVEAGTNRVPNDVSRRYSSMKRVIAQSRADAGVEEAGETRGDDYLEEPLINQPDHLFVGHVDELDVPNRFDEDDVFRVFVKASTIVETFRLEVTNITGMENIYSIDAFITGQVEALTLGQNVPSGSPATIHVPLMAAPRSVGISTTFNTFGKFPPPEKSSYVLLHIMDNGGKEHVYEYEVTDQFNNAANNGRTIVVPIPIVIDPPSVEGGGLSPTVTQWDEERTEIIL